VAADPSATVATFQRLLRLRRSLNVVGLSSAALAGIASQMEECSFPRGSVLLGEGDPVTSAFSLVDGEVRVSRRGTVIGRVGAGFALGSRGLLLGKPLGVEFAAETDVSALVVESGRMATILEDYFPLLHEVIRDAAHVNVDLRRRLGPFGAHPPAPAPRPFTFRTRGVVERIMFLRRAGPFQEANVGGLAELADAMRFASLEPGTVLWNAGEPADRIVIPVSGLIECLWDRPGLGPVRFQSTVGVPLGSRESVAGIPRWYRATAETKTEALELGVDELIDIFEDNFEMAMRYLEFLNRASLLWIEQKGAAEDLMDFVASQSERAKPPRSSSTSSGRMRTCP
jgi:CRP-like cAMP-binding protein